MCWQVVVSAESASIAKEPCAVGITRHTTHQNHHTHNQTLLLDGRQSAVASCRANKANTKQKSKFEKVRGLKSMVLANAPLIVLLISQLGIHLLSQHGAVVYMDSTHDTNALGVPLFTFAVRLPTGTFHWIAFALSSSQDGHNVARILQLLRQMAPRWVPYAFMLDCDRAERNAVQHVFPWVFVLLCEFHVKQAWRRALSKKLGQDSPACKGTFLQMCSLLHYQEGPLTVPLLWSVLQRVLQGLQHNNVSEPTMRWVFGYIKRWVICKVLVYG